MSDESSTLLLLAESDPGSCVERCRTIIQSSSLSEREAHAYRAMGVALRSLGRIAESKSALESAVDSYRRLGMQDQADEAMISLAASVAVSGDFPEALEMLEPLSMHEQSSVRAHAQVQLAGLVARSGDFDEALRLYAEAEPQLKADEDLRWLALLYSTRGLVHTFRNEFDAAELDITGAVDLFHELGRKSSVAEMKGNLGFMYLVKGDIATGISVLLEADELFRAAGLPPEANSTARAYGYMLAGLPERAREVLTSAARSLEHAGRELEHGEALVLASRAALAADDFPAAIEMADAALAMPNMAERNGWRLQAELVRAEAGFRSGQVDETLTLEQLGTRLVESGNMSGAAQAWALAALVALGEDDRDVASRLIGSITSIDEATIELPIRIQLAIVEARFELSSERVDSAVETLHRAADLIDDSRVLLSATESRAGLSRLSDEIAALGLNALYQEAAVQWLERFRGSSLRIAPVVPNRDPDIAEALADLRRATNERRDLVLAGESSGRASEEIRRLESKIRDLTLAHPDEMEAAAAMTVPEIKEHLTSREMLYIYDRDGETVAEILTENGVRSVSLGSADRIRVLTLHLLSGVRRAFRFPSRANPRRTYVDVDELAETLFPLGTIESKSLVVVPPADLLALPWNALASRAIPGVDVVVAPSAGNWIHAEESETRSGSPAVAAGPRLSHASAEAGRVVDIYGGEATLLDGESATVEAVLDELERCSTFHAVAHGHLRGDNPMFSALELHDGNLNLYLLEKIDRAPSTVVLSACDSAHGNVVGGLEMYGLSSVLLGRGAKSILSTVAPIPDSEASIAAVERVHRGLRDGKGAARSIGAAQAAFLDEDSVDPSLAFVAYGAF